MRKIILFIVLFCSGPRLYSQNASSNETLKNDIQKFPRPDTQRVNALIKYIRAEVVLNSNSLLPYIDEAIAISKKIDYKYGLRKGMLSAILYYGDRGNYDKSFLYADSLTALLKNDNSEAAISDMGFVYLNTGNNYFKKGDLPNAASCYMSSAYQFLKVNNTEYAAKAYLNISATYESLNDNAKAGEYTLKAMEIAKSTSNDQLRTGIQISYIADLLNRKEYAKAETELNKIEPAVMKLNNSYTLYNFYFYKALCARQSNNNSALAFFNKSLTFANTNEDEFQKTEVMRELARYYLEKREMVQAKIYLDSVLLLANSNQLQLHKKSAFDGLEQWYTLSGNIINAQKYKQLSRQISDSLLSDEKKKQVEVAEVNFILKQKETEIEKLKAEQEVSRLQMQQKTILNYVLAGSILSVIIISLLSYRTYKQKQKLQQQQIIDLEKEKQLLAADAVLEGQEQERTRLAKDLHDGLGGMLSGIKYSFTTMKGNLVLSPDNSLAFERSMDMLDSSIKELRLVAHNLMPENLVKFGLDTALKDFCNDITASGVLKVKYHSFGMEQLQLNQNTAIIIYRIIQELISNAIKHAAANEAIVQLQLQNNELQITVEDDGKGFDVNNLNTAKGIGWSNIKNRLDYLQGTVTINSEQNKWTSINIEINV